MQPWAEKFYASTQWRRCRNAYFKKRHGICERCGKPGKIVHHKIVLDPVNINDPMITLNDIHFELLCQDCHNKEHNEKYGVTMNGVHFNEYGELVQS